MSAEQDPGAVAIGDTFKRVGCGFAVWEVTGPSHARTDSGEWFPLTHGNETISVCGSALTDSLLWRRARAPEWGYVYEVRK